MNAERKQNRRQHILEVLASELENMDYPTMIMPHDGYHYPLDALRTWPDPEDVVRTMKMKALF